MTAVRIAIWLLVALGLAACNGEPVDACSCSYASTPPEESPVPTTPSPPP